MRVKKMTLSSIMIMLVMLLMLTVVKADNGFEYPFETGNDALVNGVKWTGPAEVTGDYWQYLEVKFDNEEKADLSAATHIGIQVRTDLNMAGFTVGLIENFDRFTTITDGQVMYFVEEDGTVNNLEVLYQSINIPTGKTGTLVLPMASLGWQWNNAGSDLTNVNSLYITTNSLFNAGWEISVGAVGYYNVDPMQGGTIDLLRDLELEPTSTQYYVDSAQMTNLEVIGRAPAPEYNITYPFRTGEESFLYGKLWRAPAAPATEDDWQTLKISFDDVTDFSEASYLTLQMENVKSAPGITYGLTQGDKTYTIASIADGGEVYYVNTKGLLKPITNVLYSAITANVDEGGLVIPMNIMGWDEAGEGLLDQIDGLVIKTNLRYNFDFDFKVGEIGFFTGDFDDVLTHTKVLSLESDKTNQFSVSGQVSNETVLQDAIEIEEREVYGDTIISFTATGTIPGNYGIWDGGSLGKVEMDVDSYGDTAVKMQANGTNPTGDSYTAITISGGGGFSWENREGITMWARNDSDGEISFNVEIDNKLTTTGASDRFNIQQGHRFYLYDVNTNKTYIYLTKPTITLPVGFEGWIRVPFTAFKKADWSAGGTPSEQFMKTGTIVSYLAITIHSTSYNYMPFTLNKIGAYQNDPSFISTFVVENENRLSIETLMDFE